MNLAWKELKKSKARFIILGAIVYLISLLTFIISGLANGLSQDNAGLIKDLPNGQFYMTEEADETYNLSQIDIATQQQMLADNDEAVALSIQMGFLHDDHDKRQSVAFVTTTGSPMFAEVSKGEVILDSSLQDKGIQVGDLLKNDQLTEALQVKGFVEQKKFSHAPVAFIHQEDYEEMYRTAGMQLVFVPNEESAQSIEGLVAFSNKAFLNTIPSYNAEQLSLNMIIWFLVIISGMLFAIFFYMMNVQKIGLYGILKAIGVKTTRLFRMMWLQMLMITIVALMLAIVSSQLFSSLAPEQMPFHLTLATITELSIIFMVIGFIGSTLSGIQIQKVQPLQAIQQGEM